MLIRYGMRSSAKGWEGEFTEKLEAVGFKRGRSNPVAFYRSSDETSLLVHGDDFVSEAPRKELLWFDKELKKLPR